MANDNQMREKLRPCPFCGELPQIVTKKNPDWCPPDGWSWTASAPEGESIACVNKKCPMQPSTAPAAPGNVWVFRINWNTRANEAALQSRPQTSEQSEVERVAEALWRSAYNPDYCLNWNQKSEATRYKYQKMAKAALAVMGETK